MLNVVYGSRKTKYRKFVRRRANRSHGRNGCKTGKWEGFRKLPFLKRIFLVFCNVRFPKEVQVRLVNGELKIKIKGPWYRIILWEVPLLAIVSELYFHMTGQVPNVELYERNLRRKAKAFATPGFKLMDFSTRRRVSFEIQENAVLFLKKEIGSNLLGTSNCYIAFKHGLSARGTHAHEWFQAHQGMFGTRRANLTALESGERVYGGSSIALTVPSG